VDAEGKPGFFAIASPPDVNNQGVLELLVKRQPGSAADAICDLAEGSELKVSPVMVSVGGNTRGVACLNIHGMRVNNHLLFFDARLHSSLVCNASVSAPGLLILE
jgi:hypothetical protein